MTNTSTSRGKLWLEKLSGRQGTPAFDRASVIYSDGKIGNEEARFIAVVPDPNNRFPRARNGEVGLEQGWALAKIVRETVKQDEGKTPRIIVAVVDVTSQAYGKREEMLGIQLACAAAADAYIHARLAGHIVISILVGKAMSGAFLAHGYQANRMIALDDKNVLVHAMGKEAAARITRRKVAELEELGNHILPMSYDIRNYAKLGLLYALVENINADAPSMQNLDKVHKVIADAVSDVKTSGKRDLSNRLTSPGAQKVRAASIHVRKQLAQEWNQEA